MHWPAMSIPIRPRDKMGRSEAVRAGVTITIALAAACLMLSVLHDAPLESLLSSAAPAIPELPAIPGLPVRPHFDAAAAVHALPTSLLPNCVVNTCNNDWQGTDGAVNANQDNAGCSSVRSMLRMKLLRPNVTGHWCKAYRAVQMCNSQRYRYFIFRDDDTRIDVATLLALAHSTGASLIASYKGENSRAITNWFLLDTRSQAACAKMREWWALARPSHPEHDQKFFNSILTCGKPPLHCIDKREGLLNEVHCRSSLGSFRSLRRQECMRYQADMVPELL